MEKLNISGMSCHHCAANVENAVGSVDGVKKVKVNLEENNLELDGNYKLD